MKRRSILLKPGHNDSLNSSLSMDELDEEAERRGRVRNQRRQSLAPIRAAGVSAEGIEIAPAPSATSGYSAAQLAEHYTNCVKLSAENKINVKNAFSLHMIDYMAEMVRKKQGGMDNFQAASCALDASAKIYGYRVDALHSDTLKLAGGVGQTAEEGGVTNGNEERNENDAQVEGGEVQKKVRKKRTAGATIEKNLNNINLSKFDLEFDVDPLFKKTSAQFDSGSGGGKFLCNLLTRDDTCQMLLDSKAIQFMPGVKGSVCEDLNNNKFTWPSNFPLKLDDDSIMICPEFLGFKFNGWSPEEEDLDNSLFGPPKIPDPLTNDEHVFDAHAPVDDDFDDGGIGGDFVGADDGDVDAIDDVVFDEKRNQQQVAYGVSKGTFTDVENLKRHLSYIPCEYSYFDSGRLMAWAGPQHWKFRQPRFPSATSANALVNGEKRTRVSNKSKELQPHDFEKLFKEEPMEENLTLETIKKAMTVPKVSVKLNPKTMDSWSEEKLLLPEDLHYSGKDLGKLYHCDFLIATKSSKQMPVDDSVADYDFDNDNDVTNFCPETNPADGYDDDEGPAPMDGEDMLSQSLAGPLNQSLVAMPNRVEKIQVGYAKQAKKMDMRRLKQIEWDLLSPKIEEMDVINTTNGSALDDEEEEEKEEKPKLTFSGLYKELHTSKKMPTQMEENLSVSLAIVALLHLCNENNLVLQTNADFSDFAIYKG